MSTQSKLHELWQRVNAISRPCPGKFKTHLEHLLWVQAMARRELKRRREATP